MICNLDINYVQAFKFSLYGPVALSRVTKKEKKTLNQSDNPLSIMKSLRLIEKKHSFKIKHGLKLEIVITLSIEE